MSTSRLSYDGMSLGVNLVLCWGTLHSWRGIRFGSAISANDVTNCWCRLLQKHFNSWRKGCSAPNLEHYHELRDAGSNGEVIPQFPDVLMVQLSRRGRCDLGVSQTGVNANNTAEGSRTSAFCYQCTGGIFTFPDS